MNQSEPIWTGLSCFVEVHWKDWCWSWNSNTLATWCKELTHLKRLWCWERLKAWVEGDNRGWDGGMASLTQWTWIWVNSRNWWWTGKPGVLRFIGSQRVGHDWVTELSWFELVLPSPNQFKPVFIQNPYYSDPAKLKFQNRLF